MAPPKRAGAYYRTPLKWVGLDVPDIVVSLRRYATRGVRQSVASSVGKSPSPQEPTALAFLRDMPERHTAEPRQRLISAAISQVTVLGFKPADPDCCSAGYQTRATT